MFVPLRCILLSLLAAHFGIAGSADRISQATASSSKATAATTAKSVNSTSKSTSTTALPSPTGKLACAKQHSKIPLGVWYNYGPHLNEVQVEDYVGVSAHATVKDRFGKQRPFLYSDQNMAPQHWDFWNCTSSNIATSGDTVYYGQWTPTRPDGTKGDTCLTVANNDLTQADQYITLSGHCDIDSPDYTRYNIWNVVYLYYSADHSVYFTTFARQPGFVGADPDAIAKWYNSVSPTKFKGHSAVLNQYDDSYVPDDDRRRRRRQSEGRHAKRDDYSDDVALLFLPEKS